MKASATSGGIQCNEGIEKSCANLYVEVVVVVRTTLKETVELKVECNKYFNVIAFSVSFYP